VITIFGLSYAVTNLGLSRSLVLGAIAVGAAGELITIPLFGALSDFVGRRPSICSDASPRSRLSFPIFWGIETRDALLVTLTFVIGMSVGDGVMAGVQASFLSEMFPPNVRYGGASLGYQLAAPIGGGVVPRRGRGDGWSQRWQDRGGLRADDRHRARHPCSLCCARRKRRPPSRTDIRRRMMRIFPPGHAPAG
jgi:MFS family permease